MFGQGRGGRQAPEDFDDIFSMFNQQQGGGFGSGRFGQPSGGFRGYGGPQQQQGYGYGAPQQQHYGGGYQQAPPPQQHYGGGYQQQQVNKKPLPTM